MRHLHSSISLLPHSTCVLLQNFHSILPPSLPPSLPHLTPLLHSQEGTSVSQAHVSFLQPHTLPPSHPPTFTPSLFHTLPPSHPPSFTPSYFNYIHHSSSLLHQHTPSLLTPSLFTPSPLPPHITRKQISLRKSQTSVYHQQEEETWSRLTDHTFRQPTECVRSREGGSEEVILQKLINSQTDHITT